MLIENVKTTEELDNVLEFAKKFYPDAIDMDGGGRYSRAYWLEQFNNQPELILYAKDGDEICGIALGCVDWGKNITVGGDGVLDEYKNKGVHEAMFIEIEKRGAKFGYEGIGLGIEDGQEEFYARLGYVGKMLIQSEKHSVDELKNFFETNFKHKKECEITGSGVWDGYVNQLWLNVPILDKEIKSRFEKELEGCWTQIIVNKGL